MLLCSKCPKEFVQGYICKDCSKLFCSQHQLDSCAFCGGKLEFVKNEIERIGVLEVNWLVFNGSKRVGVVGINFLPSYTMKIESADSSLNSGLKIVLFDSKEKSIEFEKAILKKHDLDYRERLVTEKSRYSIIGIDEPEAYYLLLNTKSIGETTATFLTALNSRIIDKIRSNRGIFAKQEKLMLSFGKVFFAYNRKMGIPFISAHEEIQQHIRNLVSNVQQDYFESIALRELLENRNYFNDIGEYIKYKIEVAFSLLDFEARFILIEVFQTLEKMLHIAVLLTSISSNTSLAQFLMNVVNRDYQTFKKKYSELPDLIRAADYIFNNQSKIVFSTYDEYVEAISSIIQGSFSKIEARYVSLAEGIDLFRLSQYYLAGLEKGEFASAPNIGTIYAYVKLLQNIMQREGIYPEVRIIAGYALENTLLAWLLIEPDFSRFQELATCTKQLAELIETNLPEIQMKNGSIDGLHGSPITYEDAAMKLLTVSRIARSFGSADIEKEFCQTIKRMINEYDLLTIKIDLLWIDFVDTQNFSYLTQIHEIMRKIDLEKFPHRKHLFVPIDLLVQSILYQEKVVQNIEKAQEILLDSISEGVTLHTYAQPSIRTTEAFYYLLEMFKHLLEWQEKTENIKKAYFASLVLAETLLKIDPILIMSIKTRILYKVLNNDLKDASSLCKRLASYEDPEAYIKQFLDITKRWIEICLMEDERKYIYQHEFQYKGKDIWIQILLDFIHKSMEDDLTKNIAGSKALVFVEGITDLLVLKTFKDKIRPNERINFIDIEGYANYKYYAESKVIKKLRIPTYLIFDGDTRQTKKRRIIKDLNRLSIQTSHIYTLKQNSIENYILKPKSINRAYSKKGLSEKDIKEFFAKTKNKKNKKQVLQWLFNRFKLGSYGKKAAEQIAIKTKVNEIDPEITQLLKRIMKLETV
jgi:hypothetical protein